MKQSITVGRNKIIVGNNSKSYNDKHPDNPVSLRPIYSACERTPMVFDGKRLVPDYDRLRLIRSYANFPRMMIKAEFEMLSLQKRA